MRCPDWTRLSAHRRATDGVEPAAWEAALAHLRGCRQCRSDAIAADPSLVFAALEPLEVSAEETADMVEVVARLRRLDGDAARPRLRGLRDFKQRSRERRAAIGWVGLAATVLVAAMAVTYSGYRIEQAALAGATEVAVLPSGAELADPVPDRMNPWLEHIDSGPLVQGVDLQHARIYQLASQSIDLVVIVDDELDLTGSELDL